MKQLVVTLLLAMACSCFAQAQTAEDIIKEGVALHDAGKYKEAIAKYDEALAADPKLVAAMYEKAYSLTSLKQNAEALEIAKRILKEHPDYPDIANVYSMAGNALDDLNRSEEALKIYDEGIKRFPQFYLFYYNKGLSLARLNRGEEATRNFQKDLLLRPVHTSAHLYMARMYEADDNLVPAVMAYGVSLLLESKTSRATDAFSAMQKLLKGNARVDSSGKNVNISLFMPKQTKKKDDDFSTANMGLSLMGGLGIDKVLDSIGKRTDVEKMRSAVAMIMEQTGGEKKKGFAWKFYVPFYTEMKRRNFVETFCYLCFRSADNKEANDWLIANATEVAAFYEWMEGYAWPKKID